MADNYLEKRYAEVFGGQGNGHQGPRKPSLDSLLSKCRHSDEFDPDYTVHPLQIQAVMSVLERMDFLGVRDSVCATAVPELSAIELRVKESAGFDLALKLGAAIQAMALKAAELGLACRLERTSCNESLRLLLGRARQS